MLDKKLTNNEIVKALECCAEKVDYEGYESTCCSCSLITDDSCTCTLAKLALDLINRLQLDNEMLRTQNGLLVAEQELNIKGISATALKHKKEAYKECIDIIKNQIQNNNAISAEWLREYLDNLLKEKVGDNDETKIF